MSGLDPNVIITGIITFAGGGALAAVVKAWRDIRAGAATRADDTVGSLRRQRDENDRRAGLARRDADHYHHLVGRLLIQLSQSGIEPVVTVEDLIAPSQHEEPAPASAAPRRRRLTT